MPECAVCEDDVPRGESPLPFRSHDRTVALAHRGCEDGDRLSLLARTADAKRATHVCEACAEDVPVRHVEVTGAHRERDTRKQFRCPRCGAWTGHGR